MSIIYHIYNLFFGQGWEQSIFFYVLAMVLLLSAIWQEWSDVDKYKKDLKPGSRQYPAILQQPIPRSRWRFVPGILTAIGVLGTFYGITVGLADISLNNIGADSQNLLKSSVTLLEGMKTAFSTSLVGLGSSSIFTLFLAYSDGERRKAQQEELAKIPVPETPVRRLSNMNPDANQRASKSLADAAENMGIAAGKLQEFALDLKAILGEFRTDTKDVLQQVATEVKETVNQSIVVMKNQQNAFDATAKQAATTFIGIREELEKSLETQAQIQRDSIKEFQNSSREIFAEQSTNLKQVGEQTSQAMIVQRNAFTASAKQTAATFVGIREQLEKSLETQAQIQQQSIEKFQNDSRKIFEQQANNLGLVSNAASQQMNEARENLTATLTNIDNVLQNTRLTVQEELQTFRLNYQAALQEFFMQQNQLLEGTLGEQRRGLADVVANFKTVFEEEYNRRTALSQEMQESLIKIQQTTKVVSNLANTIGLNSGERLAQLQELARTVGGEASRVQRAYDNLNQNFDECLRTWNQELKVYFNQKAESDMKFFTEADKATAQVCNQLLQAANYLVAAESTRINANEKD